MVKSVHNFLFLAFLFLIGPLTLACCAEVPATSDPVVQDLAILMQRAKGGDAFSLLPGHYDTLELKNLNFSRPVVIDGHDKAVFDRINLRRVHNVTFRNIIIKAGIAEKPKWEIAFNMWRSSNIRITSSDISWSDDGVWTNDGVAVTARLSDNIFIQNTHIHDAVIGIVSRDSSNMHVLDNRLQNLRMDGMEVSGTFNLVFENNLCTEFHPVRPVDHPDCIQLWNDTAKRSNENITIRGNRVLRGAGGVSQGIFISGLKEGLLNKNLLIENNIIHQGMGMGIYLQRVDGAVVRNNKLSAAEPVEDPPAIVVRYPVQNIEITGNTADHIAIPKELTGTDAVRLENNVTRL